MKEPSFEKKLASYVALATSILAANAGKVDAQIVYHDVNPDSWPLLMENHSCYLDLNGDGCFDIKIKQPNSNHISVDVYNVEIGTSTYSIQLGEIIDTNLNFLQGNSLWMANISSGTLITSSGGTTQWVFSDGPWIGQGDEFAPFRFTDVNSQNHYGWLRLEVININQPYLKLKDYAYNSIPDSPIIAGDIGCNLQPDNPIISNINSDSLITNEANNYQWLLNGDSILGALSQEIHVLPQLGNYSVIIQDTSGCYVLSDIKFNGACDTFQIVANAIASNYCMNSNSSCSFYINNVPECYYTKWSIDGGVSQYGNSIGNFDSTTYAYAIIYNPINGCTDTSNIATPLLFPAPPIPILSSSSDTLFCNVSGGPYTYI